MRCRIYNARGVAIPTTLLVIMIVLVIVIALNAVLLQNLTITRKNLYNKRALFAAEAGMSRALACLQQNNSWNGFNDPDTNSTATISDVSMPSSDDTYTVRVFNNFSGSSEISNEEDNITIPPGDCLLVSRGNSLLNGVQVERKVGAMLRRIPTFGADYGFAVFTQRSIQISRSSRVYAYNGTTGQPVPGAGHVGTNGYQDRSIYLKSQSLVNGNAWAGPQAALTADGLVKNAIRTEQQSVIAGEKSLLKELIMLPDPVFPTGLAPGNDTRPVLLPGNYSSEDTFSYSYYEFSKNVTLKGPGTFVFDYLELEPGVTLTVDVSHGPVEIFAARDIYTGKGAKIITTTNASGTNSPGDCKIYGGYYCRNIVLDENVTANCCIYAPRTSVYLKKNSRMNGAVVSRKFYMSDNAQLYYDTKLMEDRSGSVIIYSVDSWMYF